MLYWYEHNYPFNFLFDLSNVLSIVLITLLICKYFKISGNFKILCLMSCFTPFLFNGFLFEWTMFPDQTKYLHSTALCRTGNCPVYLDNIPLSVQNIIYTLVPIPFIEGFKSVAFINRLILISFAIYLYVKKFNKEFILLLFFLPSMILYSSVSIRDSFTVIVALLMMNFYFDKKYYYAFFVFIIFYLIKPPNAFFIGTILIFHQFIFINKNKKLNNFVRNFKYLFYVMLFLAFYFYIDVFLDFLNHRRLGFYDENFRPAGSSLIYNDGLDVISLKNIIGIYLESIFNFLTSPIKDITSSFGLILIMDTILLYVITVYFFLKIYNKDEILFSFWFGSLIFLISIYAILIFNDGTIHRYKMSIFIAIIFGIVKSARLKSE